MKTWFITGVGRGLGQALASEVLKRGDTVIGTSRTIDKVKLEASGGRLHLLSLDLAEPRSVAAAITQALDLAPQIDVLVNNAGYGLIGAAEAASDAEIEHLFAVNVFAPFQLIRGLLPRMRSQAGGHIVNVTSIAGRAPMASSALYAAAKSAMEGLSHALQQEVAPLGLRVTAVAPGAFRTDFLTAHSIRRSGDAFADIYAQSVGAALLHLDDMAGRQLGDPARAATAIMVLVDSGEPPTHMLLGSDALRRSRARITADLEEMDRWEEVTRSTDFVEDKPS